MRLFTKYCYDILTVFDEIQLCSYISLFIPIYVVFLIYHYWYFYWNKVIYLNHPKLSYNNQNIRLN